MFLNFVKRLQLIVQSRQYWLTFIGGGLLLLGTALYFQYSLDEQPCVVCIQIRLLITALIIVSFFGLFLRSNKVLRLIAHFSILLIAISFVERCYLLLGTERGFVFADCGFSLGLPTWFAIEEWIPWLYRIETSCGYTPEIIFGITMAEALMLLSVSLLLFSICVLTAAFISLKTQE